MATLQELLAAQEAANTTTTDPLPPENPPPGDPTTPPADPTILPPEDPLPETVYQIGGTYVPPAGSYLQGRQHMIIRSNGIKLLANEQGYFVPENEEDAALLAYYDGLNAGLVTKV